jgi:hypothetical protein
MTKIVRRETAIFFILMVALSLLTHPDLLISPMERLSLIQTQKNYLHPFLWSSAAYLLVGFIRLPVQWLIRRIRKN